METEALKFAVQLGIGGIFFWLYLRADARIQAMETTISALQEKRVEEAKFYVRLQTDLDGTESRAKA